MDKVLLSDLKKKINIRSALIAIGSVDKFLSIDDNLSCDEILLEIIKHALREFELSRPLVLDMKVNRQQLLSCAAPEGYGEFKSNFTLYLDCALPENQIILVPNATPMWRIGGMGSYPTANAYTYFTDYRRPYIFLADVPNVSEFYIRGLCSRPIIADFAGNRMFNTESGKSAIYWMNVEEGATGAFFMDLVMVHVLDFLRQLKSSIMLPGISVDVMGNVDNAYQELRGRCDQFIATSGWYGDLVI